VVLREVAGVGLVAPLDLAGVGLDGSDGDLEQRRLADAVGAEDRQPVAALTVRSTPSSTLLSPYALRMPVISSTCLPEGRRGANLKVG
jgi:hypothetical protein